jgi:hypothetical protein
MKCISVGLGLLAVLVLSGRAVAQEVLPLHVAHGIVQKVDKDSLTIQPRVEGGAFGKPVVLKMTGTSKISLVTTRDAGKVVVQREIDAKELRSKQAIAITYTTTKDGNVLLSAVVQPAPEK